MTAEELVQASAIFDLGEREFAAYMRAVEASLHCRDPLQRGQIWIETMESLAWPKDGHEKFFRRVTGLSLLRLTELFAGAVPRELFLRVAAGKREAGCASKDS